MCVCVFVLKAKQLVGGSKVNHDTSAHEDEPKDLAVGISIQNLTKIYDEVRKYRKYLFSPLLLLYVRTIHILCMYMCDTM